MAKARRGARRISRAFNWIIGLAIIAGLFFILWQRDMLRTPIAVLAPTSKPAFEAWLAEDPARAAEFGAFQTFLAEEGVADVVPTWHLARVSSVYAVKCDLPYWTLPPRDLWPNIVPALKLIEAHVIPTVGEVEVLSSYRTPELNACAGGASRSRHMQFHAVDLAAVDRPADLAQFYGELCAMQVRAGPQSNMGLGAYYDPSDPVYNPAGRFHIDATGFRNWGRSYTATSSPCPDAR